MLIPSYKAHSEQAAIMVFRSHLLLVLAPTFLPSSIQTESSGVPFGYIKLCPYIHKQFSIDSFFYREGHPWGFLSRRQTNASDVLPKMSES